MIRYNIEAVEKTAQKKNNYRGVTQFGRVLGLGPRCRRFKSCHLDHRKSVSISLLTFYFIYVILKFVLIKNKFGFVELMIYKLSKNLKQCRAGACSCRNLEICTTAGASPCPTIFYLRLCVTAR